MDAFRGVCILGMVLVHLIFDLQVFYGLEDFGPVFHFIKDWGGVLFILLSGTCVTLGSHPVRRGLIVLGCGYLCSLVVWGYSWFCGQMIGDPDLPAKTIQLRFGILHCLGVCMLLWPVFRKLPGTAVFAAVFVALGFWFRGMTVDCPALFPLGLVSPTFASADYFPLFPNLGWFLLGAALGLHFYREKKTLFPHFPSNCWPIRFLSFCGRQSLWIYLAHQPLLLLIFEWL